MRFSFTEEQLVLRDAVTAVLADWCTPGDLHELYANDAPDAGRSHPRWNALFNLGITALHIPEVDGGLGLDDRELIAISEAAGRVALPEPLSETAGVVVPILVASGAGHHALEPFLDGGGAATLGGVTFTPSGPRITSVADGDRVRTSGITQATASHHLLAVSSASGPELHLAVTADGDLTRTTSLDRTRRLGTLTWTPTDATRLASGPLAATLHDQAVDRAALYSAAELLGLCDAMITLTAAYVSERKQFGVPVGSFQAVKHHLAGARVKLEFARPAVYAAAWSLATEHPSATHDISLAKSLASDAADEAARVSLQCHGAIGYTFEHDLHLLMKRAWALSAAWGDARSHRARLLNLLQAERSVLPS